MGHTRPRYNEKGRQVKRQTGKRKLQEVDDSNAEILDEEVRKQRRAEVSLLAPLDIHFGYVATEQGGQASNSV